MFELILVGGLVLIAGIYLFKKLHKSFTKPYDGCGDCSCSCSIDDKENCDSNI
jgi:hypothetical protein